MANQLDELTGPVNAEGRDINVIQKQIPAKVTLKINAIWSYTMTIGYNSRLSFLICKN
nr:hypothetical protein [Mycoplasmopsis bovis]